MTSSPTWIADFDDAALMRHFGAATVARGRQVAALGRVGDVSSAGPLASAPVRGSSYRTYQTAVSMLDGTFNASCSCPMRTNCKHAVALILRLRHPGGPAQGWRQLLGNFREPGRPTEGRELGLMLSEEGAALTLRPVQKGVRGNWVRSGSSWDDLQRTPLAPRHKDALDRLLEARSRTIPSGHRAAVISFDELLPSAWDALAGAVAAGVELVAGTTASGRELPTPELSMERLEPTVEIAPGNGHLEVTPVFLWRGEAIRVPGRGLLGRPAHGVSFTVDDRLWVAPLTRPLRPAEQTLFTHGQVTIPESERAEFAEGYLPQLRRRTHVVADPDLDLPEPSAPRLLCRVDFGDGAVAVGWGFRYRVGSRIVDVPRDPAAGGLARDTVGEAALLRDLPQGPWLDQESRLTGNDLLHFLSELLPELRASEEVEVVFDHEPPDIRRADDAPEISLSIDDAPKGDWFDLRVEIFVGTERVPLGLLLTALAAGDDHLLLDSGTWFPLDGEQFDALRRLLDEARDLIDGDAGEFRLRPEHAGFWEELAELGVVRHQADAWRSSVAGLLDQTDLTPVGTPAGLRAELRGYQGVGVDWITFLRRTGIGGILADEMGLGKTLQALAAVQVAHEAGELDAPVLVVAPTSVLGTWAAEAARFTPDLTVAVVPGTRATRRGELADFVAGAQIVVTSYTLLRLEAEAYQDLDWSMVLLDEAQFVKNHASKANQAVRALRAPVRIALTGTPLENNLMELWALLAITAPGLFPEQRAFTTRFRRPIESGDTAALESLHRKIRPLILRRTKADVAAELPDKIEQVIPVELAPAHRKLYDRFLARERQKVLGLLGDFARNRITILRSLTLLRQLSLSPALVNDEFPEASAKIDLLADLVTQVAAEGHRALVFSQFTGFLTLVRHRLTAESIGYEYLDGRTRDRQAQIAAFKEGDAPVFLISLKAGGFGLTLTEADYVFILDPWWNPAAELQAIDRTHRIGQDKPVNVYRLVASDTIEEKVVALQDRKRQLFDAVLGGGSDTTAQLTPDDVVALLEG